MVTILKAPDGVEASISTNHQFGSAQTSLTQSFEELFPAVETFPVRQLHAEHRRPSRLIPMMESGVVHSAYWHRIALTAHSEIARKPERFGIRLSQPVKNTFLGKVGRSVSDRRGRLGQPSLPEMPDDLPPETSGGFARNEILFDGQFETDHRAQRFRALEESAGWVTRPTF